MRIYVDEMPINEWHCPFSTECECRVLDKRTKKYYSELKYECQLTKDMCDLYRDRCSGLIVKE